MVELESDGDDADADSCPVSDVAAAAQRKAFAIIQARGVYPALAVVQVLRALDHRASQPVKSSRFRVHLQTAEDQTEGPGMSTLLLISQVHRSGQTDTMIHEKAHISIASCKSGVVA